MAIRLTASLACVVVLLVLAYMVLSHRQRRALMAENVAQQVDLITAVISTAARDLLQDQRPNALHELLTLATRAEAVFAAALIDSAGNILSGGAVDRECLERNLSPSMFGTTATGRLDCGTGVRWSAVALPGAGWLFVGLEELLLDRAVEDALLRQLLLLFALVSTFAITLFIVRRLQHQLNLAERFATVGRFSGALAHELGAPLTVIGMRAEAIEKRSAALDPVADSARAIMQEVRRITAFIEGLLHLSQRRQLRVVPVDASAVVREAVGSIEHLARDGCIDLIEKVPDSVPVVEGDHALLTHAVRNVVRNAVQAMHGRPDPRRISIAIERESHHVLIVVEDNGPGIPADKLMQVFEPFVTDKPAEQGIGLGLSISQGIIIEHGGDIWIERVPSGGTRVSIRLPTAPSTAMPAPLS